ncbi:hypothetical protein J6590_024975 [Homalodisca vitripennis]|nr:hypothetical protein J6590_024975 [Homalodisca vitripennis]
MRSDRNNRLSTLLSYILQYNNGSRYREIVKQQAQLSISRNCEAASASKLLTGRGLTETIGSRPSSPTFYNTTVALEITKLRSSKRE